MTCGAGIAHAVAGALLLVYIAVATAPAAARSPGIQPARAAAEIRALWVLRSSLTSPESIATLVASAKRHGFNALFVQVRGRGDAYYAGDIEPRARELSRQPPNFDPLAFLLAAAHAADLQVHAWINVNLVASATYLPTAGEHIVTRHPEWLMVPRELARQLFRVNPASRGYVARLARWTRENSSDVEGLYASPTTAAAVAHLRHVVRDVVRRYAVDGIHFDYARYPSDRFDYSRTAIGEFRKSIEARLPAKQRQDLLRRQARDPLAFTDALPAEWREFRVARMTSLIAELRNAVRAERPVALVSVAVAADMQEAIGHRLQDWPRWLERGIVDAICPMAYTIELDKFGAQIAAAVAAAGDRRVWAGIGAYRLTPEQTITHITTARRVGANGVVLFSYDSIIASRHASSDYLFLVGRAAFTASPADGSR